MSKWTHIVCPACYQAKEPSREPSKVVYDEEQEPVRCCFCLAITERGIFYRADPAECKCPENHVSE